MRMINLGRCAFILMTLAMLAAYGADKTVTSKELGFEIAFPENWTVKWREIMVFAALTEASIGSRSNVVSVQVTAWDIIEGTALKDFVRAREPILKEYYKGYELLSRTEPDVSFAKVFKISFNYENAFGSFRAHGECYLVVAGKRGYIITAAAAVDDYDKYAKSIDAIVKSFKLLDVK